MPELVEASVDAQVRIDTDRLPDRLQIDLKVETVEESAINFKLKLVALFDLLPDMPAPDHTLVTEFINERALFLMFPLIREKVRQITTGMGMKPLELPMPYHFDLPEPEEMDGDEEVHQTGEARI